VKYSDGFWCQSGTNNHATFKIALITFLSHSDIQFGVQEIVLTRTTPLNALKQTAMWLPTPDNSSCSDGVLHLVLIHCVWIQWRHFCCTPPAIALVLLFSIANINQHIQEWLPRRIVAFNVHSRTIISTLLGLIDLRLRANKQTNPVQTKSTCFAHKY